MEKQLKIAIYSGTIRAPVFIENLIHSLEDQGIQLYLFGRKISSHQYFSPNIHLFLTPKHRILLIGFILSHIIRLIITRPNKFIKIVKYYCNLPKNVSGGFLNWWGKVLPVVNFLPDIFHIQWAKALPNWFFLKELFGVRIILSLRGTHITLSPFANKDLAKQYRNLFPKIDKFHAVSKSIGKIALKYGAESKDVNIIYSAVNSELIRPFVKTNWSPQDIFQFISVGRFHWVKGYHYALTAIKNLLENNLPVHYTIITEDVPPEEILYQIKDLSIQDYITFLCTSTQKEVYQEMNISDCLILPSVEEGIANVVLEAMAIGLPVISSDCGGMKEVIDHGKNGLLFRNRDVDCLTQVMADIFNQDPDKRKSLVKRAKMDIKENHSFSRLSGEMKELYHSIMFA